MRRGGRGNRGWSKGGIPLALALSLGLVGYAAHAQGPATETPAASSGSWWKSWFGGSAKLTEKSADEEEELAPLPPPPAERIAAERDRQWRALHRRLAVCDQIKLIANDTNNDALQQQAIDLENRAFAIYHQHTDHLLTPAPVSRRDDIGPSVQPAASTSRSFGGAGRNATGGEGTR